MNTQDKATTPAEQAPSEPFAYFVKLNGCFVECHADEPKAFPAYTHPAAPVPPAEVKA